MVSVPLGSTTEGDQSTSQNHMAYYKDIKWLRRINEQEKNDWPLARCCNYGCETREKWKLFESVQVRIHGGDDEKPLWCRTCWRCIMKREKLVDEAEARTWIVRHKPDYQRRVVAAERYEAAKKHQLELFAIMPSHEKYKARKILETHSSFKQVFSPLAQAIAMKDEQMQYQVT